jgi:hypothetical protein
MAMKIRIEILSGWPVPEIPERCSREPGQFPRERNAN